MSSKFTKICDALHDLVPFVQIKKREKNTHGDDDDDDELFLWYGWPTKDVKPYLQPEPLSEILTIANLRHAASRIWTSAEPKFRLSWIKLCSSDNHYTTAPQIMILLLMLDDSAFNFTKSHTPPWLFSTFFKLCKNGTKSRKASHI